VRGSTGGGLPPLKVDRANSSECSSQTSLDHKASIEDGDSDSSDTMYLALDVVVLSACFAVIGRARRL
jgi:hypothetical protein